MVKIAIMEESKLGMNANAQTTIWGKWKATETDSEAPCLPENQE